MLVRAKRLYVLVPMIGLIAISQVAQSASAPPAPISCKFSVAPGTVAGELNTFNISDVSPMPQTPSKIQYNNKLTIEAIFQKMENFYGPLQAKAQFLIGFQWVDLKKAVRTYIGTVTDRASMFYAVSDLLFSMKDAHVSVSFPTTLVWRLPIQLNYAENGFYVQHTDSWFPKATRVPALQDQVISINGQAPDQFMKLFSGWNSNANDLSDKHLFALSFGAWAEETGKPLLRPDIASMTGVDLNFQTPTGETYSIHLPFLKTGTGLDNVATNGAPPVALQTQAKIDFRTKNKKMRQIPGLAHLSRQVEIFHNLFRAEVQKPAAVAATNASGVGRKLTLGDLQPDYALPKNFKPIQVQGGGIKNPEIIGALQQLMDGNFFLAGTYQENGRTVGYLRIKDYEPDDLMTMLTSLRFIIHSMGATDYMVIDQTNNPGGQVIMSDLIIKSLVGQYDTTSNGTGKSMRYAVKPNMDFLRQYKELRDSIALNQDGVLTSAQVADFVADIDKQYAIIQAAYDAKKDLSDPISMVVVSKYFQAMIDAQLKKTLAQPMQTVQGMTIGQALNQVLGMDLSQEQLYLNKPVAFVINAKCFSGGDQTPAQAQDYGRATIWGLGDGRTGGAGGTVIEHEVKQTNDFTAILRMTESLMVRPNGALIENRGVIASQVTPLLKSDIGDQGANVFARLSSDIDKFFFPPSQK